MRMIVAAGIKNIAKRMVCRNPVLDPLVVTLYVTPQCNLQCGYCAEFGRSFNRGLGAEVPDTAALKRYLGLIRERAEALYVTGGEPLLRGDIEEVLAHARRLGFFYIALSSNGLLLHRHPGVLDTIDNLVISVDSLQRGRHEAELTPAQRDRLFANVRWAAERQRSHNFTLTLNAVLYPGRIGEAREVHELCRTLGAEMSVQWLSRGRKVDPALAADPEVDGFLEELLRAKLRGEPVSPSIDYLRAHRDRSLPSCTPTVAAHVDWRGRLAYPCRELPDHILVDLVAAGSYRAALSQAVAQYGAPPAGCTQCGERCYVELSALVARPWSMVREVRRYSGQRRAARAAGG